MAHQLFQATTLGSLSLSNRMVMAPMTRNRNTSENVPTSLMATYYSQRASAGLIVTEGTSPSPNGTGYPRIPGIYNEAQIAGWKAVTDAVHEAGGKIFLQIMHTGLISHPDNLPEGARVVGPSAHSYTETKMFTDKSMGFQPLPTGQEMTEADIKEAVEEYVQAARNAVEAGFDGVELHGANGYLIQQFLNPGINQRQDAYGGSIENRSRFALEVAREVVNAIGAEKVGMRLSPYGVFNETTIYPEIDATYEYLARELSSLNLVYLHLVDHSSMGAPEVSSTVVEKVRSAFSGSLMLSGGYGFDGVERAESNLEAGKADLIAFGRTFLANPDLPERLQKGAALNDPRPDTFYTPGAEGYTDYPALADTTAA